jgi:hypothetical protein
VNTVSTHRRSIDNGASWVNEGEPFVLNTVGAASITFNPTFGEYLSASTFSNPFGDPYVYTYRTNGVSSSILVQHVPDNTWMPPSVASRPGSFGMSPRQIMAYVENDANRRVRYKWSDDSQNWSSTITLSYATGTSPALAYAGNDVWVLFYTDRSSGRLRSLISRDNGGSFATPQNHDSIRTFHRMGAACETQISTCSLAFTDGSLSNTPVGIARFSFDVNGSLVLIDTTGLGFDSYGAGAAQNPSRWEFVWRDRGRATILVDGGWTAPPTLDTQTWVPLTVHAAPSLAWGASWSEWSAWYAYHGNYDR